MPSIQLYFLGPPRVLLAGHSIDVERRKAVALLAYLTVTRQSHSRESLAAIFWPEADASRAFAYLRRALWEIKDDLGDHWLSSPRGQVVWQDWEQTWLDTAAFEQQLGAVHPGDYSPAGLQNLQAGIQLYQGDFLNGFTLPDAPAFDEWQFFTAERLRSQALAALEHLSSGYAHNSEFPAAIDAARRWVSLDSFNEAAHRQLMLLYNRAGQRAAALRQFESLSQLLERQFGLPPQPDTIELYEKIRRGDLQPAPTTVSAPTPALPSQGQIEWDEKSTRPLVILPTPATAFIGRSSELADIDALFSHAQCRLLTLLGPGGIGKTRLALEAASRLQDQFPDGVVFISLAGLADPQAIIPVISHSLDFDFQEKSDTLVEQLAHYLRGRQLLLVLDNFEQLISEQAIQQLNGLLEGSPGLKFLLTSRARLDMQGECIYTLSGMRLPGRAEPALSLDGIGEYSAIRLFVQSARRIRPEFSLDQSTCQAVIDICHLADGMPLGIILAASWISLMSPQEILEEMQASLDFLETAQQDVPERQRSIRAVFNASWHMLSPSEQQALLRLSVFPAGFTRPAAQEVAGASLRLLHNLFNKSLLQRLPDERFSIHELLRQFAREKLLENPQAWDDTVNRFTNYHLDFMTWAWIELRSPRIKQIRQAMAAEFDNLLQAWFWALERGLERRVDPVLLSFLFYFSMLFDPGACDRLAEQSIRVVEKRDLTERSNRLLLARLLAMHAGGPPWDISGRFIQNARRSLEIIQELDAQQELAIWHSLLLGTLAPELGPQKSLELFQEPLSHLRRSGDPWGIAFTLRMIAEVALWNDDAAGAYPPIQEALQIDSSQGDLAGLSMDYSILRSIRALEKDIPAALAATERQQEIQAEIGDRVGSAASLYDIGTTYLAVSDFPKAAEYFHKTQLVLEEFDFRAMVSSMLSWRSIMAVRMGELDMARRLRQENQQLARQLAYLNEIVWGWAEMGEIERICLNFSAAEACYQTALQTAAEKRVPNLVSFVNRGLGQIKLAQGDADGAAYLFSQAAANAHDDHFTWGEVYALAELGQARALLADFTQGWLALRQAYVLYPVVETSMQLILAASLAELLLASGETVQAAERAAYVGFQQAAMFETRRQCEALLTLCETRLPPYKLAGAIQRGRNLSLESALIPLASP